MRVRRGVVLVLGAAALWGPTQAAAAQGDPTVERQAWTRTGLLPTFVGSEERIYVATTAGTEEARAFVQLDVAGLEEADIAGGTLDLAVDNDDSLLVDGASIAACAAETPLTGEGEVASTEAPIEDCTARIDVAAVEGAWSVPLRVFAGRWVEGEDQAVGVLVLKPALEEVTATWRLSFDTTRTEVGALGLREPPSGPRAPPEEPSEQSPEPVRGPGFGPAPPVPFIGSGEPHSAPQPLLPPRPPTPRAGEVTDVGDPADPGRNEAITTNAATPSVVPFVVAFLVLAAVVVLATPIRRRVELPPRLQGGRLPGTAGAGVVTALALLPMTASEVTIYKAGLVLIFVVAALGLQVLVSWAGQLSLAHAGMVGVPAFLVLTMSEIHHVSPVYLVPLGVVSGALVGGVVALPTLRAKGVQVALVTLAAGIAIDRFFFTQPWLVGAVGGRVAEVPSLGPIEFTTSRSLYPLLVLLAGAVFVFTWFLLHSKLARGWFWVSAEPDAAAAFGIPVTVYRVSAFAVAGAYAGCAGALTVLWVQRLTPQAFPTGLSFTYLLVAVLAGRGYLGGVVVAAVALEGGRLFSSGAGTVAAYAGPVALIIIITRYGAGLNGVGRNVMERMRALAGRRSRAGLPVAVPEPIGLALIAGILAVGAGFLAIIVAWYHTGNTDQVWIQNQELLSGGVGGLGLIIVGVGLLIRDGISCTREALLQALQPAADGEANGAEDSVLTSLAASDPVTHDLPEARLAPEVRPVPEVRNGTGRRPRSPGRPATTAR